MKNRIMTMIISAAVFFLFMVGVNFEVFAEDVLPAVLEEVFAEDVLEETFEEEEVLEEVFVEEDFAEEAFEEVEPVLVAILLFLSIW